MALPVSLLDRGVGLLVLTLLGLVPLVIEVPPHRYLGDGNECRECGWLRGVGNHS